jgi:fermentation-respiration switch protein FrsA (DUF1100 family)
MMLAVMEPELKKVPATSSALRRAAWRVLRIALAVVIGVVFVLFLLQAQLIFPGAATQGTPTAELPKGIGGERVTLKTASGDRVVALFGPALTATGQPHPDAAQRPTFLFFYGNGMCLSRAAEFEFNRFRKLGLNVMIPDYVGYGLSGGKPSETGCYQTADACYEHLLTRKDIDPRRIIFAGRSLGGAVAIDLASRRNASGLVVFCTFTSMTAMMRLSFPLVPTVLLRHKFDSVSKIGRVSCPILIGHGSEDTLIPPSMSKTLAAAATKARVTSFVVEGAEHNDLDYAVGGKQITEAMTAFLASLPTP